MGFKKVKTADGSYTIYHPGFGESYHSVSAGAVEESFKKFLLPSQLLERTDNLGEISILEVGFGLGYNLAVAVVKLLERKPSLKIRYIAFEKEINPLIEDLELPEPYNRFYGELKTKVLNGEREFFIGNAEVKILLGDARKRVGELKGFKFDAIFHDAFSPKRNPELWTLDFLEKLKGLIKGEGFWVSYSTALPVRKALYLLGFKLFNTKPVGRKSPGTAATLKGEPVNGSVYPLTQREFEKLLKSPKAVPYRDPCLCLDREEILKQSF